MLIKHSDYRLMLMRSTAFLFLLLLLGGLNLKAKEIREEFSVLFPLNGSEIVLSLDNNAESINNAIDYISHFKNDPNVKIVSVSFCGTASPEGPSEINRSLAEKRLRAVEKIVREQVEIPQEIISYNHSYIPWKWLREQVENSDIDSKAEVLAIIDGPSEMVSFPGDRTIDSRVPALQQLNGGKPWQELNSRFFNQMRMASAVIITYREDPETEPVDIITVPEPQVVIVEETVEEVEEVQPVKPDDWYRKMYIKTNVPAWALLWQNIAVEFDLAKHWSLSLPVYWSPYNYGKQTLKFRTLAFVPELRYWPKAENMGFFVNAHFGIASYNYAKNGEYRYQDHDGKTPAIGGGIGLGYRFYFCKNHHWAMEVAAGAGVYRLDYDIFLNTPQTSHGYLIGREKRTFYGLDQAAFTISYSFGLRKKGVVK